MSSQMIPPYVNERVWYYASMYEGIPQGRPLAGIVTYVHNETLVDVTVFTNGMDGRPVSREEVSFLAFCHRPGEEGPGRPTPYCEALPDEARTLSPPPAPESASPESA